MTHKNLFHSEQNLLRYPNRLLQAVFMVSNKGVQSKMARMECFGEMWARNPKNITDVPASGKGGQGVYILYDGSTPVYVGKGNIQSRLRKANNKKNNRKKNSWDYFSWCILKDQGLIFDVEVLLLRILITRRRHEFASPKQKSNAPTLGT